MQARILTKWGQYKPGDIIQKADKHDPVIPPHAAEFFDDDAELNPPAASVPEGEVSAPKGKGSRKGSRKK